MKYSLKVYMKMQRRIYYMYMEKTKIPMEKNQYTNTN